MGMNGTRLEDEYMCGGEGRGGKPGVKLILEKGQGK